MQKKKQISSDFVLDSKDENDDMSYNTATSLQGITKIENIAVKGR